MYDWAFLPMRASNDLLGDRNALRARLDEDSYLFFKGVIDPDKLLKLRRRMLTVLESHGWVRSRQLMRGIATALPPRESDEEYLRVYDDVQRVEEFHTLAHDDTLVSVMRQILGDTAFPHPLKVARLSFPGNYERSTPPHQDWPNNQGTTNLTAAWIPVGDCSMALGPLAILRGSHRWGLLPLQPHLGAGNRAAVLPVEMREQLHWVTTEFEAGDVLVFPALAVHAALHNTSDFFMRISVDFRYQCEGEELSDLVLQPHFGRLSWEDIYAGWKSDRYQYYWKNLDFSVVPFRDLTPEFAQEALAAPHIRENMAVNRKIRARYERRIAALEELDD